MKDQLMRQLVRLKFRATPRKAATQTIQDEEARYLELINRLEPEACARPIRVPRMLGVDEDMRDWSLWMILEHNTIVNRQVTAVLRCLARGETFVSNFNPKTDVMPSENPGPEQIDAFRQSVDEHLAAVEGIPRLRRTGVHPHPLFGPLNAHGWHCMFGLHLLLHRKQAEAVAEGLS